MSRERTRTVIAALVAVAAALAVAAGAAAVTAPAGATAQCRDGTFSFSQHRSGTCSRHGGVATWLDAAGTTSAPSSARAASASATASARAFTVGRTVLLAPRTRTSGCTLGPSPDRRCSPGAYSSGLTTAVLCAPGFHTSAIRHVTDSMRATVERAYGMTPGHYGSALEIDHIVSLELGGSNDIANLFPERAAANPGFHVKDRLENRLHALVCSGAMSLRTAQTRIAADWQSLYRSVFATSPTS